MIIHRHKSFLNYKKTTCESVDLLELTGGGNRTAAAGGGSGGGANGLNLGMGGGGASPIFLAADGGNTAAGEW